MDERSTRNGYANSSIDRADKERPRMSGNEPDARFVLVSGERALIELTGGEHFKALHDRGETIALGGDPEKSVFLGNDATGPVYGAHAPQTDGEGHPRVKAIDMRSIATQGLLPDSELALVGTAKSLISWHARHGFCANCGAQTAPSHGGWRRDCAACNAQHFPRVDPVVIMLAVDGDRALLARGANFIPNMYSALAGFIEPGETIEDAVRRELEEEAGIRTAQVRYHSSQPWPFPSSLMIGCMAHAETVELDIDTDEIAEAAWFTRAEIAAMMAFEDGQGRMVPPPSAIAHQLLTSFVEKEPILPEPAAQEA